MIALLLLGLAHGAEVTAEVHGELRSFTVASVPRDSLVLPSAARGDGLLDGRLLADVRVGERWHLEIHHAITVAPPLTPTVGTLHTGVGVDVPEAIPLTWTGLDEPRLRVRGRTDRLVLRSHLGAVDLALGRQAVPLGTGVLFTPVDLLHPQTPMTVDTAHRPGVDAARADVALGDRGGLMVVGAYDGSWDGDGLVGLGQTSVTLRAVDLALLGGWVRGDLVLGGTVAGTVGAVDLYLEGAVTRPSAGTAGRVVGGVAWSPTPHTHLRGEAYLQTLGAREPRDYLALAQGHRYVSGELWLLGRWYSGVTWEQELSGATTVRLTGVANLTDPSLLLLPRVDLLAGEAARVSLGAVIGLGESPAALALRSELGSYPLTGFAEVQAAF